MITKAHLRQIIREELGNYTWPGDADPRPTPPEQEFIDSGDTLVGYIVVRDVHDHVSIAHAPITQTDGPDRPFLVRTTDTKWHIPFWMVRLIYPGVQDAFNSVDSKEDWRGMGPGDRGQVGEFEWEWVESEPAERMSEGRIRIAHREIRQLIEASRIGAGDQYAREFEDPMSAVQEILRSRLSALPREEVMVMPPGDMGFLQMVEEALDEAGVDDSAKRSLISRPLRMVPPLAFLSPAPKR